MWSKESASDMLLRKSESSCEDWRCGIRESPRSSEHEAVLMIRANNLGLKGWVRNNPDESVEGAAVGPKAQIDDLYVPSIYHSTRYCPTERELMTSRTFLSKGPSAAKVDNVEYIKDISDVSDAQVQEVMGGKLSSYEVR